MSTVKLYYTDRNSTYKNWELLPEKLLIVEDITSYLATKTAMTIENFQYQKCEFEMGINVELAQSYAQPKTSLSFKYVSIQNTGEQVHYYFVKKAVWRSKTCVRFELVMDVLNTFQEGYDYTWKANTKITREHKDRFERRTVKTYLNLAYEDTAASSGTVSEGQDVIIKDGLFGEAIFTAKLFEKGVGYITLEVDLLDYDKETIEAFFDSLGEHDFAWIFNEYSNYFSIGVITYTWQYQYNYFRKIDFVPEGINPVLIRKEDSANIEDTGLLNQNWYLLYRNANDPDPSQYVNPVECYLIPENETKTDSGYITGGRLVPSWLEEGKWYVFSLGRGESCILATLSNGVVADGSSYSVGVFQILVSKAGDKINVMYIWGNSSSQRWGIFWQYDDIDYITFSEVPVSYRKYDSLPELDLSWASNYHGDSYFNNSDDKNVIDGIANLDRADAKNIKCIKLPYCPFRFSYTGDTLEVDGNDYWERASFSQSQGGNMYALHLIDNSIKLENILDVASKSPFVKLKMDSLNPNENDIRRDLGSALESKLYHSAFYSPTYVYDSFALKVDLEKCKLDYYIDNGVISNNIKFTMTSTINSKFMFTLTDYVCNKSDVNFYNVLPIARNNEEVLYNVPYINFIKTGYNYEIKAKNIQNASNFIGLGMSTASLGVALAVPTAPLKAAAVVGALVSMAMSVKSTVVSAMQSEENIKQKLTQYQNQASSVAGSDDVDLMSEYCDNRLKYMVYEPTDNMKALLNDLFFYAGYSSNRMGIPTHNNRLNFDYLECEASIEAVASMPQECLTELITCFKNGVVYLHKTNRASDKWDFEQKYENWENSLLED